MKKIFKSASTVYLISLLSNVLVFYFIYLQFSGINELNDYWKNTTEKKLANAAQLAEVERQFGYVGFIHHFKNYIIRKNEHYYLRAVKSYESSSASLHSLKSLSLNQQDRDAIEVIESTLDEYYQHLIAAKHSTLPIKELDELLKINDTPAENALNFLRSNILPRLKQQQQTTTSIIATLKTKVILGTAILIPLLLLSAFITIRIIKRFSDTTAELSTIFESSHDAILYIDHDGRIIRANRSAAALFGYHCKELQQLYLEDLVEEGFQAKHKALREEFNQVEQSRTIADRTAKIKGRKKDGSLVDLRVSIASKIIHDVMRNVCILSDQTEQKELQEKASKDHLSSLYNRRSFDETLSKEIRRNNRENKTLSILLIDIDHFKPLNDNFGHTAGDEAIKLVANYLKAHTRAYDHVARWGGDEFVILCPDLPVQDSVNYAERIRANFEKLSLPWQHKLTLSIGIASTSLDNPMSEKEFIDAADKAVYTCKKCKGNLVKHVELL